MRVLQLTYKAGEVKIKQFTTLAAALAAHHTSLLTPLSPLLLLTQYKIFISNSHMCTHTQMVGFARNESNKMNNIYEQINQCSIFYIALGSFLTELISMLWHVVQPICS